MDIDKSIKKVILTKNGFCGLKHRKKLCFKNYKNENLIDLRVSRKTEYFIDIITNSSLDKFALITN